MGEPASASRNAVNLVGLLRLVLLLFALEAIVDGLASAKSLFDAVPEFVIAACSELVKQADAARFVPWVFVSKSYTADHEPISLQPTLAGITDT